MFQRSSYLLMLGLFLQVSFSNVLAGPTEALAEKVVSAMHKKMNRAGNSVLVSETDFYDGDSHLSLPIALTLKDKVIKELKKQGFNVINPSSSVSTAWVVHCRWKRKGSDLTIAFIANPWKNWKRGRLITHAKVMPKSTYTSNLFIPDMDAFSRTLIHRLGLNDALTQPRNVYLRPLQVNGSVAGKASHLYFNHWLKNAVDKSNLLLPLNTQKVLASTSISTFRTRGFRPVAKKTVEKPKPAPGLMVSLLDSQSELKGQVELESQSVTVSVDLLDDGGKKLSTANVDVPLNSLPSLIAKDLRAAGEMEVSQKVGVHGLDVDISTTRGEGETEYKANEKIQFLLRVNRTAYLYLFDLDSNGNAVVLYPNAASTAALKPVEGGKILILPDDGLDYEIIVSEPYGKDIIWVVASDVPLAIPKELTGDWSNSKWLKNKVKSLGTATGKGYAEAQVLVVTSP